MPSTTGPSHTITVKLDREIRLWLYESWFESQLQKLSLFLAINYWLGGEDKYKNYTFLWMDGAAVKAGYTKWFPGTAPAGLPHPGISYAIRTSPCDKWQWVIEDQTYMLNFLCEA